MDLSEAEKKAESEAKEQASKAVKEALAGTDLTDDQKAEIQSKVKDSISISDTTVRRISPAITASASFLRWPSAG